MSRKHFEIWNEKNTQNERSYFVKDTSSNGTWLNEKLLKKENKYPLHDGDEILVINDGKSRFGFKVTIFPLEEGPIVSIPSEIFAQKPSLKKERTRRGKQKQSPPKRSSTGTSPITPTNSSPPELMEEESQVKSPETEVKPVEETPIEEFDIKDPLPEESDSINVGTPNESASDENNKRKPDVEDDGEEKKRKKKKAKTGKKSSSEEESKPEPIHTHTPTKKSERVLKWTSEEEQRLLQIMEENDGKSWRDIAVFFAHRSPDAVRNKYKKMMENEKAPTHTGRRSSSYSNSSPSPKTSDESDDKSRENEQEEEAKTSEEEVKPNEEEETKTSEEEEKEQITTEEMEVEKTEPEEEESAEGEEEKKEESGESEDKTDQVTEEDKMDQVNEEEEKTKEESDKMKEDEKAEDSDSAKEKEKEKKKEAETPKKETKREIRLEDKDRQRKPWTPEEDELLRVLIKRHKPNTNEEWELVASQLGRTVKSIKHKFNDYHLRYLLEEDE